MWKPKGKEKKRKKRRIGYWSHTRVSLLLHTTLKGSLCQDNSNNIKEGHYWRSEEATSTSLIQRLPSQAEAYDTHTIYLFIHSI